VTFHAGHRQAAHLGAIQGFEDVVGLLRAHDADDELHGLQPFRL
jgi:hypothetical protein